MAAKRGLVPSRGMPAGWRELESDGSVACPHRDVSVCAACDAEHEECVEVLGAHFWVEDEVEREELKVQVAAVRRAGGRG